MYGNERHDRHGLMNEKASGHKQNVREECNIILRTRRDMLKENDKSGINVVYKQARIWNRFHYFLGQGCSYETYKYLNNKFKALKREAIRAIS